jgi:hypothetical protein
VTEHITLQWRAVNHYTTTVPADVLTQLGSNEEFGKSYTRPDGTVDLVNLIGETDGELDRYLADLEYHQGHPYAATCTGCTNRGVYRAAKAQQPTAATAVQKPTDTNEPYGWIFSACREQVEQRVKAAGVNWRHLLDSDEMLAQYEGAVRSANRDHDNCWCVDSTNPCDDWCRIWHQHFTQTAT